MTISRDMFIDKYVEELQENVHCLEKSILVLKRDPRNEDELVNLLRVLHTVKGSSRMLKFNDVEGIAHGLENVFKGVKDKRYGIDKSLVQLVFLTVDYLRHCAERVSEVKDDRVEAIQLLKVFEKALANEPYGFTEVMEEKQALAGASPDEAGEEAGAGEAAERRSRPGTPARTEGKQSESVVSGRTVRIETETVNEIVRKLNGLIIRQMQFKKSFDEFDAIDEEFSECFSFLRSNTESRLAFELGKREKSLRQKLGRLRKELADGQALVENDAFEVQEDMINLRMLPVALILGSLERMVEETAMSLGKEIDLVITGMDVLLDKMLLERIGDPIIHLVRNAVDHGIELPAERESKGKGPKGRIDLDCHSEHGKIVISIKDDGAGLDYAKIREKAAALHPDRRDRIEAMGAPELGAFLFSPGFSTKDDVTILSGRGVGLDIVKHNVERIKGRIEVASEQNAGTRFILTLPLSLATSKGYFIRCAGRKFFLPSEFVEEVVILDREEVVDLARRSGFGFHGSIIPLYDLSILLKKEVQRDGRYSVVVIASLGERVGMIVDSILEHTSLIFKPLPRVMAGLEAVQGVVFDECFDMICILHSPALIEMFKRLRSIDLRSASTVSDRSCGRILVVDDSPNTRQIEKSILELAGYSVDTATDGIDALEKIRSGKFDLVLTDLEMPRMNGFTMIENIRKNERAAGGPTLPIVVVTGHGGGESRDRVQRLGVAAVILKADFERGDLLSKVESLIGQGGNA